jgi:hypothetical protein
MGVPMTRSLPLLLALVTAGACTSAPDQVDLDLRATLNARTHGVALHDNGLADAAMAGQICLVDTVTGDVLGDRDLTDGSESVLDARGDRALGLADGRLHQLSGADITADEDLGLHAADARLMDDGFAAIAPTDDACTVEFSASTGTSAWSVPGACGGFAVDADGGAAWIADGTALTAVQPDGAMLSLPDAGVDTVEWDGADGLAIVASTAGSLVTGVDGAGEPAWTVEVRGTVHDLATSESGLVVASVEQPGGGGEIVVLDGADGTQLVSHLTPDVADVIISGDGLSIGLVTADQVHFYDLTPDARPMDAPTAEQTAGVDGAGAGWTVLWGAAAACVILD